MRKIFAITLALIMLLMPLTACAQARTLPEFLEAYAARMVDMTDDFDDTISLVTNWGDDGFVVMSSAGTIFVSKDDLTVEKLYVTYMDIHEDDDDKLMQQLYNAYAAVGALEYGVSFSALGDMQATDKIFELMSGPFSDTLSSIAQIIRANKAYLAYEGESYTYSYQYMIDDVPMGDNETHHVEELQLVIELK